MTTPKQQLAIYTTQSQMSSFFIDKMGIANVKSYGAVGDGVTDDTTAINNTITDVASAGGGTIFFPEGTYVISNCITVSDSNLRFEFDGATFNISDTGADGELTNGLTGKIGFLFKECVNLSINGYARLIGQGTVGSTSLAGMVFDTCDKTIIDCNFYYENMAAGRFVMWCDYSKFGDIQAYRMKGTQTFDTGTAGSAEVVIGCKHSKFGRIVSLENYKPIRYCSAAYDATSTAIDNEDCEFGFVYGTAASGSLESSVTSIRSAVNCVFNGGYGDDFVLGFNFIKYNTDDDFSVDGNVINVIYGDYPNTAASLNTAVQSYSEGTVAVGNNIIEYINVVCAGEVGIYCASGELTVIEGIIDGGTRCIHALTSIFKAKNLKLSGSFVEVILVGANCVFNADYINITTGFTGTPTAAVKIDDAGATSNFDIKKIKYRQNATGNNVLYVFMDLNNAFDATIRRVHTIDGTGSTAQARFVGTGYSITNGALDLQGTLVWDPGNLADGAGETSGAITVTGAALGDFVIVAAPYDLQGITCNGYVSAANTVKIRLQNETTGAIDLASGTWKAKVIKP